MTEQRSCSRQRVLKTGKILFAGGACVMDYTIKNVSQDGAMLCIANAIDVPDQFQFMSQGASFYTRLKWCIARLS